MAKRPAKPPTSQTLAFEIPNEETTLEFTIRDDQGTSVKVTDSLTNFHLMVLESQQTSGGIDVNEYVAIFTQKFKDKYGVEISQSAGYMIVNRIFDVFHSIKKN